MIPQIIVLALAFTGLLIEANRHNKPKDGKHNFWVSLVSQAVSLYILYWGGFFNNLLN